MSLTLLQHVNLVPANVDVSGLLDPQRSHVVDLIAGIEEHGFACDLSGTGTGKTYMACAIARHINAPVYIVAPKSVKPSWIKILTEMGVKNYVLLNYEQLVRGNTKRCPYICKKSLLDPRTKTRVEKDMLFWLLPSDAFIIFDESHKCKGMKSATGELLLSAFKQGFKFLTVSATQAVNALDMFVYGHILGEHSFMDETRDENGKVHKNFYDWCREFGGSWTKERVGFECDGTTPTSKTRMKELHDRLFKLGIARRLTSADFGNSFAENHIMPSVFDMGSNGDQINDIFETMESEIAELTKRGQNYSAHIFAAITRARRQAEILKAPTIVEQILTHYDEGKSIAVFVNYRSTVEAIVKRVEDELGKNTCAVVQGGQKDRERQANIDAFQNNTKRIIICNMAAGGVGISLHDIHGDHERVSIISPSYSAIQFIQALGRIHRAEGKTPCSQYIVYCAGTIEETIAAKVCEKLGNLDALNDGDMMGKDYGLPVEVQEKISDDYFDDLVEENLDSLLLKA